MSLILNRCPLRLEGKGQGCKGCRCICDHGYTRSCNRSDLSHTFLHDAGTDSIH